MALTAAQQKQMDEIVVDLAEKARTTPAGGSSYYAQSAERIATAAQLLTPQPMLPDWAAADEVLAELIETSEAAANEAASVLGNSPPVPLDNLIALLGGLARQIAILGATLRGPSGG